MNVSKLAASEAASSAEAAVTTASAVPGTMFSRKPDLKLSNL